MAARKNSQRANYELKPDRVEITTEGVEGVENIKVPHIMGVMADLSGANNDRLGEVEERTFSRPIDVDNFNSFLEKQEPRVVFTVPSSLKAGKQIAVDMAFTRMDDFLPDAVAREVFPELLALRKKLDNLRTFAGKADVRKHLEKMLADQELRKELAGTMTIE